MSKTQFDRIYFGVARVVLVAFRLVGVRRIGVAELHPVRSPFLSGSSLNLRRQPEAVDEQNIEQ